MVVTGTIVFDLNRDQVLKLPARVTGYLAAGESLPPRTRPTGHKPST